MKKLLKFKKNSKGWKVKTPDGWQNFQGIAKYELLEILELTTKSGIIFECSTCHSLIDKNGESIQAKRSLNRLIKTDKGLDKVIQIKHLKEKKHVYDIVGVPSKTFYCSKGILHHNTHLLEDFWSSVIPTVSSGKKSKILMVSTPNKVNNRFYEIYSKAENKTDPNWKSSRIDWWDVPGRDEEWKKVMISALGSEEQFLEEFGNAFLDDSETAVGVEVIERFKKEKKEPIWTSDNKDYCVYEYPNPSKLYVIGVDVGEGIGKASTVAQVLDVTDLKNIKQVAVYGSNLIEPYHFANKLNIIGQSWGLPPILIERNNCGGQLIDALFYKLNYENLVSYTKISTQEKYNRTRHLGVLSHTNIRTTGIANLRYWVNVLQTVHINDPITISELETFIKQPNGVYKKKNDKFFDDRVMALTWALFILEPELCEQYFEIIDYDLQHKPLLIKDNNYIDKTPEMYELKALDKYSTLVPKPVNYEDEVIVPSLNITRKEAEMTQKQDFDLEELLGMGYEFVNPPEDSSDNYF